MSDTTRTPVAPEIGMGATIATGSDRYPYTVIACTRRTITLQQDATHRVDDGGPFTESQTYIYIQNTAGSVRKASLRRDGQWKVVGTSWQVVHLGERRFYRDPSF